MIDLLKIVRAILVFSRQKPAFWHISCVKTAMPLLLIIIAAFLLPVSQAEAKQKRASYVVYAQTATALYQNAPDRKIHPASLVKMMTLYLAFSDISAGRMSSKRKIRISRRAVAQGKRGSALGAAEGSRLSLGYLISAAAVRSANDAAYAIAEGLDGSEKAFVKRMNRTAKKLGMSRTRFHNSTGFTDKRQYSTARDMSKLARALYRDFPGFTKVFEQKSIRWRGKTFRSTNRLLGKYRGLDGLKTGTTSAAGANFVGTAVRNGRRVIVVVIGERTKNRFPESKRLLDIGFRKLKTLAPRTAHLPTFSTRSRLPSAPIAQKAAQRDSDEEWAIQIGAFPSEQEAIDKLITAQVIASPVLDEAPPSVTRVQRNYRVYYRARFSSLSETSAHKACDRLASNKWGCVAVSPTSEW